MQCIWIAFLSTLTFAALVSAIQRELENTDKHDWSWEIKRPVGVPVGVSLKINL